MLARAAAALMLRTGGGPLRPVWRALHLAIASVFGAFVAGRGGALYVRGTFASGDPREPVHGLSDVDVVVVVTGAGARAASDRRQRRAARALPPLAALVSVARYSAAELDDAMRRNVLQADRPLFVDDHPLNRNFVLRTRPDLYGPAARWRRLAGPERRPRGVSGPPAAVATWLELQCWWRYAFRACADPAARDAAYTCFKLVAEATRCWLWLAHGARVAGRIEALERGIALMPDDAPALRAALDLRGSLHRAPEPPLDATLEWLVGMSSRIAERIAASVDWHEVAVRRTDGPLPLADWRALVAGETGTLTLRDVAGGWETAIAGALRAGEQVALRAGGVLVLPSTDLATRPFRGALRPVQCAASDPVQLALAEGAPVARFPALPGWSIEDVSRRALAEQSAAAGPALACAEHLAATLAAGAPEIDLGLLPRWSPGTGDDVRAGGRLATRRPWNS